ncbi:hypothetical protein DPEC_G00180610 [Dallia pectoralis]|uniref:Uncharacterized protein n=1 Tax=Dallia pectoralis TaxID=75939 RepID=A0ACC2GA07_DALPE|nr:hypothetical protein DPEC_G00180610 [Dallia pectoralis]
MRCVLALMIFLLYVWLQNTQRSEVTQPGSVSNQQASSLSVKTASLLLSPFSLYSWLVSVLVNLLFSAPALVLSSVYYTILLLLVMPCCVATWWLSAVVCCIHVMVYVIHLVLVFCALAGLLVAKHKMADVKKPKSVPLLTTQCSETN